MNPTPRPRFRTDLVAEPIDEAGHRFIDVVDPDTGTGFRFYEVEYSLACAMDGERDVAGLVQWAKEDLGIDPSPTELATVISTLGSLGYLEAPALAGRPAADLGDLAPGVVAAPRAPAGAVEDVELGFAGGAPVADAPLPRADFELGFAGGAPAGSLEPPAPVDGPELGLAGAPRELVMEFEAPTPPPAELPSPRLRPVSRPEAEDDGPTNLPQPASVADFDDEVSVDLSDHLAISASDVKEAVRASRTMKAVEIPADLAAQLDESPEAREARLEQARAAAEQAAVARAAAERAAAETAAQQAAAEQAAAAQAAAEAAARPAVELPRPPVGVTRPRTTSERPAAPPVAEAKEPAVPVARPRSGLRVLLLLLLLAAAVGGAWYYWTQVLKKPLPWEKAAAPPGPGTGSATQPVEPPPPPPPPPPPSASLTEVEGQPVNVIAPLGGVVATLVADGATVVAGDEVVRFRGNAADERKLAALEFDINTRVPKQIADATADRDAATAAGNARKAAAHEEAIAERQKRLEEKTAERDALRASMEALSVKAPVGGVVKLEVARGARAVVDAVVAVITPPPALTATFTVPEGWPGKAPAVDGTVTVAPKAAVGERTECLVTAVALPQISVVCPSDGGLAAGTEIILP